MAGLWTAAKMFCQVADVTVHEMRSHLYLAHFAQEPVAVVAHRYLDPKHPIHQLLDPHFKFLLFNNDLGRKVLVNPGGNAIVDTLLPQVGIALIDRNCGSKS